MSEEALFVLGFWLAGAVLIFIVRLAVDSTNIDGNLIKKYEEGEYFCGENSEGLIRMCSVTYKLKSFLGISYKVKVGWCKHHKKDPKILIER